MAEFGHTDMADSQAKSTTKSLVSEQYLDGWPLDEGDDNDEEDDSEDKDSKAEEEESTTSRNASDQADLSTSSLKRPSCGDDDRTEKKKPCFTISNTDNKSDVTKPLGSSKISMNIGMSKTKIVAPIKMELSSQSKPKESHSLVKKSAAVAQAFGEDSDDSAEEMPAEARMRMRNIGRETPTAAGPNSFGKGRLGFCDRQKIIERQLVKKTDS